MVLSGKGRPRRFDEDRRAGFPLRCSGEPSAPASLDDVRCLRQERVRSRCGRRAQATPPAPGATGAASGASSALCEPEAVPPVHQQAIIGSGGGRGWGRLGSRPSNASAEERAAFHRARGCPSAANEVSVASTDTSSVTSRRQPADPQEPNRAAAPRADRARSRRRRHERVAEAEAFRSWEGRHRGLDHAHRAAHVDLVPEVGEVGQHGFPVRCGRPGYSRRIGPGEHRHDAEVGVLRCHRSARSSA